MLQFLIIIFLITQYFFRIWINLQLSLHDVKYKMRDIFSRIELKRIFDLLGEIFDN